jgi:O-antigen/teichoic acid export membrane protein
MFVANFGADLVLGLFFSTSEAGLYRFANRIASAGADLVLHPIRLIGLDRFRNAQHADRYRSLVFAEYADLSIFLVGAISILVASTAPWFIPLAFHSDFAAANPLVQILAFRHFARVGQGWIEPVLASNGKGTQAFRLNLLIAIASASGLGFGSTFEPTFIAQWTACVQILSIPVILLSFHRHCGIDVQPALPPILKTSGLLALLAMAAGAMSTKLADIFELSWIKFSVFGVVLMLLFGIASAARSTISSEFTGSTMHAEGRE